ncbi:cytochrome c maturation protein CcmE [Rudanella paleaurantiibacter]|jgi:cytochrome c-type biogenesis protein CcmE|uniref:Cytochrome c maturation protein CcmE n=1 Tax=Rudanella paleaurantiibacter TaxID=2614655 RepID=A0A7J5TRS0_9BACT|nr:cytochrome c maturation protein CcmE [Rudanella paleaurantiibacter]KAB7725222.1 cytochrome c maturation protein CcmE [Rudanella paleaurantiibacter]
MKLSHIVGLVVIAVAIGIIVATAGDASVYVTFGKAVEMARSGDEDMVHVVGDLRKDTKGYVLDTWYKPEVDPNHFEFILTDDDKKAMKVIYGAPKPQDFGKAERVVIIGNMEENHFRCKKILLTCPSKYQDNRLETTEYSVEKSRI